MSKHIDHIEITNFKSIRHQKVEGCKRINVFIGYPNVGKSNILEALGLFSLPYLKLSGSKKLTDFIRIKNLPELFNADIKDAIEIKINDSEACLNATYGGDSPYPLECIYSFKNDSDNTFSDKKKLTIFANHDLNTRIEQLPDPISGVFTTKKYDFPTNIGKQVKRPFNFLLPPKGNNLFDIIEMHNELWEFIKTQLMKVGSEYIYDKGENVGRIYKKINDSHIYSLPYSSIAATLQHLIFYKAAIISNINSILLFEEPETHMFPPYIRKFTGDVIYDKNENQFFISTHSPFVLDDLIEEVREELSVYLVGYKNGETVIKRLSDEELEKVYKYNVDLFFNIESYLD